MNPSKYAVNIQNASVYLKGNEILHNISWKVENGAKYFILGANGAGKTTLVRTLLGYIWPHYGAEVEILGQKYGRVDINEVRKSISWVSPFIQKNIEPDTTGVDMVLSGKTGTLGFFRAATNEELEEVENLLKSMNGLHLANKDFSQMSSGEQMKILVARALIAKPKLMILDEPSVYLDITEREFFLKVVKNLAKTRSDLTIIFISQRIEDILPEFTQGMILKKGEIIIEGNREEILTTKTLKNAFGVDIELVTTSNGRIWSIVKD